jgi:hypothetical protein
MSDPTFSAVSRLGSTRWCAQALGMPLSTFRKQRPTLEAQSGFPRVDPVLGLTIKADVDAWIEKRREVAAPVRNVRIAEIKMDRL